MSIWAVIPVKPLHQSKGRLAHILSAAQRTALMRRCLQNMLAVLNEVTAVEQTVVISPDPQVWAMANAYQALTIAEEQVQGLNVAVTQATQFAGQKRAAGVLVLPADLPLVRPSDVAKLIQVAVAASLVGRSDNGRWRQPVMAICSDDQQDGTNALLLYPPHQFTFHYGVGSFKQHLHEAARRGLHCEIVSTPGLTFDLDTEADWLAYQARHQPESQGSREVI